MTKPQLSIRPATLDDLPTLHRIAERSVWAILAGRHWTVPKVEAASTVQIFRVEDALVADGTYYVLDVDGVAVAGSGWSDCGGFSPPSGPGVQPSPGVQRGPDVAVMRATYVDPDWTRRGIATLLARVTETAAALAGFRRFEAMCTPASEGLRRGLGYRCVGRIETELAPGVSVTGAHMRKDLGS